LTFAKNIETKMGRINGPRNSPRPIDIDILFYGDLVLETPALVIPHPRLMERAFVLAPLADIAPDFKHPVNGKTVRQILKELKRTAGDAVINK
jgi:2-amino-4-hydroxy-6-hydroxymethyldihydropteridine diphosphokinase